MLDKLHNTEVPLSAVCREVTELKAVTQETEVVGGTVAVSTALLSMTTSAAPGPMTEAILKATILCLCAVALLTARGQTAFAAERMTDLHWRTTHSFTEIDTGAPLGCAEALIAVLSIQAVVVLRAILVSPARPRAEALPAALVGQASGGALNTALVIELAGVAKPQHPLNAASILRITDLPCCTAHILARINTAPQHRIAVAKGTLHTITEPILAVVAPSTLAKTADHLSKL